MKKAIFAILVLSATIIDILYFKDKIYNPQHRFEIAAAEAPSVAKNKEFQNGDIIFQTSLSTQSAAIQKATGSKYSHCGIIFKQHGLYVCEAVQPVKMTPLNAWIARGQDGKYVVKRLKDRSPLEQASAYKKFRNACNSFLGKNYDLTFGWSDQKVYCSELIWKSYDRGLGIKLGSLKPLKDFNLSNPDVRKKIKERYGSKLPGNELVISPQAIFESDLLETVKQN
jgi:hypothetical protein